MIYVPERQKPPCHHRADTGRMLANSVLPPRAQSAAECKQNNQLTEVHTEYGRLMVSREQE